MMTSKPQSVVELEQRLDDPETAQALGEVLDNLPALNTLLVMLNGFLERGDTIIESVAGGIRDLRADLDENDTVAQLSELSKNLPNFNVVATRLGELIESPEFTALMNSNVLAPKSVKIVSDVGDAFVASYEEVQSRRTESRSAFALLRELKDPQIQRGLDLMLTFARRFGQQLG